MKYSYEILVTPPTLVKSLNASATPLLPNNTKEEMPTGGKLPSTSPSTTASLSRIFPQALGMGHGWKQEPEVAQRGRFHPTCHEACLQHEEAVTATDMEKKPRQTLKNACAHALLIDWPHEAALEALTVLLGTPVSFPAPISSAVTLQLRMGWLYFHRQIPEIQQGIYYPSYFFPKHDLE